MIRLIRRSLIALGLACLLSLTSPASSLAATFNPFDGADCSGAGKDSAVCTSGGGDTDPLSGDQGIILKVTNIVAIVAGAAAVILVIVGGIRFMTAGGDANKAAEARKTVTGALIGMAVIVLGRTIIFYVADKL